MGEELEAYGLERHAVRQLRRRLFAWQAAQSWGATDYLAVLPDSVDYQGWTVLVPPVFRVTVALHLGIMYAPLALGDVRQCGCDAHAGIGCGELDALMDRVLACAGAGHAFTHTQRHDHWVRVWGAFLRAHGMPLATEPRRALQGTGCRCYDHLTRVGAGRLVGLDVALHHAALPDAVSFSTPERRLARWERRKRTLYSESAWRDQPEVPHCVPLVASTFGQIGPAARRFFESVVRRRVSGAMLLGELGSQNLHGGQHSILWRRRICVQLRVAVGAQVVGRVHTARAPLHGGRSRRIGQSLRDFDVARGWQLRVMQQCHHVGSQLVGADVGGVGFGYGGDHARLGVLGDGFVRRRSQAPGDG